MDAVTVVEVGPETVVGPNPVDPELVSAALEAIDDELALVDERAVPAGQLWAELLTTAGCDAATPVLCPTWWPARRLERVRAAAGGAEILRRADLLGADIEVSADFVVVAQPGARPLVIAVHNRPAEAARRVLAALGARPEVLVDRPAGAAAEPVTAALLNLLRGNGTRVQLTDRAMITHAAAARAPAAPATPRRHPWMAATAAAALVVGAGFAVRAHPAPPEDGSLLVEGRVGVVVPATWPVRRITSGPGSARLQLNSPDTPELALHLTQAGGQRDLARTAETLTAALAAEAGEVFVDFTPAGSRAGRAAVTYRELRAQREVAWTVLVDGGVAIAIGCQSAPGRAEDIREVCDRAVRSAHTRADTHTEAEPNPSGLRPTQQEPN